MQCAECGTTEHVLEDHDGAHRCLAHLRLPNISGERLGAEFEVIYDENIEKLYES